MYSVEQIDSLSTSQKIGYLKSYITQFPLSENAKGNAVSDVAYFRLPDGNLGIDISVMDSSGNLTHMYYDVANSKTTTDTEIINKISKLQLDVKQYSAIGADAEELQRAIEYDNQMLSSMYNADKISLKNLEKDYKELQALGIAHDNVAYIIGIAGQAEVDSKELQQVIKDGEDMGLTQKQVVNNYATTTQGIDINNDIFASDTTNVINGTEGITATSTFNQIVGENYDQYRIVQDSSGSLRMFGIKGNVVSELHNDMLKPTAMSNMSITLLQGDGTISDKPLVGCYRINTSAGGDQYLGLYLQGGQVRTCYARGGNDNLIGEDISAGFAHSTSVATIDNKLDPNRNKDLTSEDKSADKVTKVQYIGAQSAPPARDANELILQTADAYNIDPKQLKAEYDVARNGNNNYNIGDEQLIGSLAKDIKDSDEQKKSENPDMHDDHEEPERTTEPIFPFMPNLK